jgi:hypothetical protein
MVTESLGGVLRANIAIFCKAQSYGEDPENARTSLEAVQILSGHTSYWEDWKLLWE